MRENDMWGGPPEIHAEEEPNENTGNQNKDFEWAAYEHSSDEIKQSWLHKPDKEKESRKKKSKIPFTAIVNVRTLVVIGILEAIITTDVKLGPGHRRHRPTPPDNYTTALHQALRFFNAQRSGRLPKNNNLSWRGNSCLNDKNIDTNDDLVGGYYDAGDASKFSFPASFAMTMLSWSVIEYSPTYEALSELDHIKDIIKWGTDYLLKTFNSSANSIASVVAQVKELGDDHNTCWMRPEDIGSRRTGQNCHNCPALAAEMAAALASSSIIFKDSDNQYSRKLVHGADILFKFATKEKGENYEGGEDPVRNFYNSSGFWDEFTWGGTWMYLATGNLTYLDLITSPKLAKFENDLWADHDRGVFSWDNKHAGAYLLLTRLRMFLSYGYPYEETLSKFHKQIDGIMCSYLPVFPGFKRTKGGLIELNHGWPKPLQYVVNAAFLAKLYSDYIDSMIIHGWSCGPNWYPKEALREFSRTQMDYILGNNPQRMSYVVGFGDHFPKQVHHRGASIPSNKIKYGCKGGTKWRDSHKPNPNTIVGAMVSGPDKHDNFHDVRYNYNYTEPSLAGNAGLVALLVALSSKTSAGLDRNSIFYRVTPGGTSHPPSPPPPWVP